MDRNVNTDDALGGIVDVALRKESVDRNAAIATARSDTGVALRKESVDRNCSRLSCSAYPALSLSARRAWIEIRMT